LQRRTHDLAAAGQLAYGRSERIDDEIDLAAHLALDQFDRAGTSFVGKRITVDRTAVQPGLFGELVERRRVVPAGGARLGFAGRLLEEYAQRVRAIAERRRDARSQPVPGGGADHEHAPRPMRRR